MKIRIPTWLKIVVLVPTVLFLTGYSYMKYARWNILQEQKEFIRVHGQKCIESAVPIGDGNMFAVCSGEDTGPGERRVVYDTSGQSGWSPKKRTDRWRYMYLKYDHTYAGYAFQGRRIESDFYDVFVDYYADTDTDIIDLEKRLNCDFVLINGQSTYVCQNLNALEK